MRRLASRAMVLVAMVSLVAACGGTQPRTASRPTPHSDDVEDADGLAFAFIPMPTEEQVLLALFVDAGARDAEHPQVATLAAWLAAGSAPGVVATVYPDATRFVMPCETAALHQCVSALRQVLSRREVRAEELQVLHERLRRVRRGARGEALRRLELSALEGLLGAAQRDPLGEGEHDAASYTVNVRRFMSELYGP